MWCVDGAGATDATAKNPKHHQQSQGATAKDGGRWWEAFMDSAGMVSLSVSEGILAQHRLNLWGPRKRMLTAGSPRKGLLVLRCRRDRKRTHTGPWKKYACRRFLLIGSLGSIPQSIFIQSYMCICRWFWYVYYGLFLNHPTLRDSKSYRDFKRWCGGQPPVLGPAYHISCSWF